jgi:hypothetical protein
VLTFDRVNAELSQRGFELLRFRTEDAGYCWLEVEQLRRFRPGILAFLSAFRRIGIDLFTGANYRLLYRLPDPGAPADAAPPALGGDYLGSG